MGEAAELAVFVARDAHFLGELGVCGGAAQLLFEGLDGVAEVAGLGAAAAGEAIAAAELVENGAPDAEHGIGLESLLLLGVVALKGADEA